MVDQSGPLMATIDFLCLPCGSHRELKNPISAIRPSVCTDNVAKNTTFTRVHDLQMMTHFYSSHDSATGGEEFM